jgi:hypothetical protein
VYAAALVHTALRAAQARIALAARVEPEAISVQKLFPKVAAASACLTTAELTFQATQRANPTIEPIKPDWQAMPFASTSLESVLVQGFTRRLQAEPRACYRSWMFLRLLNEVGQRRQPGKAAGASLLLLE